MTENTSAEPQRATEKKLLFPYFHEVVMKDGHYAYDHYFTTDQTTLDSWADEVQIMSIVETMNIHQYKERFDGIHRKTFLDSHL